MRALCSLPEPSPLVKGGSELQRLEPPAVMTRRERILVCNTRSMTLVCFGVVPIMSAAFTPFSDPATLLRSCISYKPRDALSVLGSCSAWLCSPASAAPHLLHGLPYRPACLPARCAAPPRPRDSSNLRHPVTLFDSAPRPTQGCRHGGQRGPSAAWPVVSCRAYHQRPFPTFRRGRHTASLVLHPHGPPLVQAPSLYGISSSPGC